MSGRYSEKSMKKHLKHMQDMIAQAKHRQVFHFAQQTFGGGDLSFDSKCEILNIASAKRGTVRHKRFMSCLDEMQYKRKGGTYSSPFDYFPTFKLDQGQLDINALPPTVLTYMYACMVEMPRNEVRMKQQRTRMMKKLQASVNAAKERAEHEHYEPPSPTPSAWDQWEEPLDHTKQHSEV